MMEIEGTILTVHDRPMEIAGSVTPDNLSSMVTVSEGCTVRTTITSNNPRSVIASVDDYLMNLGLAEEICSYALH